MNKDKHITHTHIYANAHTQRKDKLSENNLIIPAKIHLA